MLGCAQMCEDVHLYVCVGGCAPMCGGMGGCVWVFTDVRCARMYARVCMGVLRCARMFIGMCGCAQVCVGVHFNTYPIPFLYKFFLEHFKHTVHFISSWLVFLPWEVL